MGLGADVQGHEASRAHARAPLRPIAASRYINSAQPPRIRTEIGKRLTERTPARKTVRGDGLVGRASTGRISGAPVEESAGVRR